MSCFQIIGRLISGLIIFYLLSIIISCIFDSFSTDKNRSKKIELLYFNKLDRLKDFISYLIPYSINNLPRKYFDKDVVNLSFVISDDNDNFDKYRYFCRVSLIDQVIDENSSIDFENVSLRIVDELKENIVIFELDTRKKYDDEYFDNLNISKEILYSLDDLYILYKSNNGAHISELRYY